MSLLLHHFLRHPPASQWKLSGQSSGVLQLIVTQWPEPSQVSPSSQEPAVQAVVQVMAGSQRQLVVSHSHTVPAAQPASSAQVSMNSVP